MQLDFGRRQFHWHADDRAFTVTKALDVESLLAQNAAERNHGTDGYTPSRDLRKIASIDVVTLDRWALEDGLPMHWMQMAGPEFATWAKRKLRNETRFRTVDTI